MTKDKTVTMSREMAERILAWLNTDEPDDDGWIAELRDLLAAPVVERQPIGWFTDGHLTDKSATTYDAAIAERWKAKGWPASPLYDLPPALTAARRKGFTTLETGDDKYRIVTSYQTRDDAWSDYEALCKASPPAPVAVVRDEQQEFANWMHEVVQFEHAGITRKIQRRDIMDLKDEKAAWEAWQARACLDKVQELNQ